MCRAFDVAKIVQVAAECEITNVASRIWVCARAATVTFTGFTSDTVSLGLRTAFFLLSFLLTITTCFAGRLVALVFLF